MNAATTTTTAPVDAARPPRHQAATLVTVGALLGLAWASSLRGWMIQLVGPASILTWTGTFIGVLLPGVLVGALLGWAEYRRRNNARRGWLVSAPLLFPAAALSLPGAIHKLLTTGIGGGAIGIAMLSMLGGFALSGRGPLSVRLGCGVLAFALVPASYLGPPMRPELDPATPLGAWAATNFSTLFITLAVACAVPLRRTPGSTRRGLPRPLSTRLHTPPSGAGFGQVSSGPVPGSVPPVENDHLLSEGDSRAAQRNQ